MDFIEKLSEKLGNLASKLAGIILIYMVLHIIYEIILRAFFSSSTYVLDEFVAYGTAGLTFLYMAKSMRKKALIRVGIVLNRLSGLPRLIMEAIGLSITLFLSWYIIYFFWTKIFWRNIIRGRVSESIAEIPLWIPESLVITGLIIFSFQVLVMLISVLVKGMDEHEEISRAD
jgi:TRAP-type C4-dicarboxylate transport system permease small subunit